jgi:uncharacterized protein YjbI with pentapeptide repeats
MVLVKEVMSEKIAAVRMSDTVEEALKKVRSIVGANKIVVDYMGDFWVVPAWKFRLVKDPGITLLRAYIKERKIFEKVGSVSPDEEVGKILPDLYEVTGLVVADRKGVVGFLSLADFSELEFEKIRAVEKPSLSREELEKRVRNKVSLMDVLLHGDYSGIDLRNVDLRSADLIGATLRKAKLRGANLSYANLTGADLTEVNMVRTKLRGANLTGTTLVNADLSYAELWNANLVRANLSKANLTQAVLFNANLESAKLVEADLLNAGMMSSRLESADFRGANMINTDLKFAKVNTESDFTGAEVNWLTMQTLSEWSLKAKWDPEVKDFVEKRLQKRRKF